MKKSILLFLLSIAALTNSHAQSLFGGKHPYDNVVDEPTIYYRYGTIQEVRSVLETVEIMSGKMGDEKITIQVYDMYNRIGEKQGYDIELTKKADGSYSNENQGGKGTSKYVILVPEDDTKFVLAYSDCRPDDYKDCKIGMESGIYTRNRKDAKKNMDLDISAKVMPLLPQINNAKKIAYAEKENKETVEITKKVMKTKEPAAHDKDLKAKAATLWKAKWDDDLLNIEIVKVFALSDDWVVQKDQYDLLPLYKTQHYLFICKNLKDNFCFATYKGIGYRYDGGTYSTKLTAINVGINQLTLYYVNEKNEKAPYEFKMNMSIDCSLLGK